VADTPQILTFKGLAHKASYLKTASQLAGLAGQVVEGEIIMIKPTVVIAACAVGGISVSSVAKTLKGTADKRAALVAGSMTLADLESKPVQFVDAFMAAFKPIKPPPQPVKPTFEDVAEAIKSFSPAEIVKLGRMLTVERCWELQD
jgi:hypothetical protein